MTNSHLKQGTIANSNNSPHLVKVFNIHENIVKILSLPYTQFIVNPVFITSFSKMQPEIYSQLTSL